MSRRLRWERRTESLLTAAAPAFLVAHTVPIVWPGVGQEVRTITSAVVAATWALFGIDYVVRLAVSRDRKTFFVRNLFDLAVLVLPLLRPLRLLRLVTLLSVLNRTESHGLRGWVLTCAAGGALLLVFCGAPAITDAGRPHPGSTIHSFGDGLWWAATTMTTVGYGDTYPITATGRFVAAALMIGGIALLGVVTATLASWLVERVAEANDAEQSATRQQVADLSPQVERLERLLEADLERRPTDVRPSSPRST